MAALLGGRRVSLPNFLIIGAMKAGTTSLYHYLRDHPQVFMPAVKELSFFAEANSWRRGLDWYERQFAAAGPEAIALGEASTLYTKYPELKGVPERIATHLPEVRLIYVVRDPIERMRSHYQHCVATGAEKAPMEKALLSDPRYLNCSRYALQIDQYLEYFSPNQLLIVLSEELRRARQPTVRCVYEFLGVDRDYMPSNLDQEFYKTANRSAHSPLMLWIRKISKTYFPQAARVKGWVDSRCSRGARFMPRYLKGNPNSPTHEEPAWASVKMPEGLSSQLKELLREDVARVRSYMNQGLEEWGIE